MARRGGREELGHGAGWAAPITWTEIHRNRELNENGE